MSDTTTNETKKATVGAMASISTAERMAGRRGAPPEKPVQTQEHKAPARHK